MRGTSAAALREVAARAEAAFRSGAPLEALAEDLFSSARVIDSSNQLVRLLSDGGRAVEIRRDAVQRLFAGKVGGEALEVLLDIVSQRWSAQQDLLDAIAHVGELALFALADREQKLGTVEEQLFSLSRTIEAEPALAAALEDPKKDGAQRATVLGKLLDGKADQVTIRLACEAIRRRGDKRPAARILALAERASERRQRLLAVVTSARPLSSAQMGRLPAILHRIYGRDVHVNVEVSESVVGGLRIQVGGDLYDATVLARLSQARDALAA